MDKDKLTLNVETAVAFDDDILGSSPKARINLLLAWKLVWFLMSILWDSDQKQTFTALDFEPDSIFFT